MRRLSKIKPNQIFTFQNLNTYSNCFRPFNKNRSMMKTNKVQRSTNRNKKKSCEFTHTSQMMIIYCMAFTVQIIERGNMKANS